ncbi:MAG: hypothetical protein EBR30_23190, partial [Cytophagia bacterium]|nr:hypothetical protein [Cytophagia bacterium]
MGCTSSTPQEEHDVTLADYPMNNPESEAFQLAKALRNKGAFDEADSVYQRLLNDSTLTPIEKEFIQLNQLLCRFAANDTLSVDAIPHSTHYAALSNLINAIASSRRERNSLEALYQAREQLKEDGLANSFYYFTLLEQLGLVHKQRGSYLDSTDHYYNEAYHFTKQSDALVPHRIRLLYRRALHSLVHRDELTGIGYIEEAMSLRPSANWCARLFIAKATLYRKINRPDEAALSLQEANQRIKQLKLPELKYLYFYEQCFQGIYAKDSLKIFSALDSLKTLSSIIPEAAHYIFHLKGHYYYERNKVDDYVFCFEKSLAAFKRNRWSSMAHIYQALYALTEGYTKKGDYSKAETYAFQSLAYATHLREEPYTFENIFNPSVQAETYNFINYDLLGSIYLERFERDKKKSYLQNAFRIYTLIDSLMLHQIRTREDESTYEFLRIGHGIYANGIETCYQLFKLTADSKYVNQAHLFMERSKSLITYQDILKHDDQYFPSVPKTFKEKELKLKMNLSFIKSKKSKASAEELSKALTA